MLGQVVGLLLVLYYVVTFQMNKKKYPKGPIPLPIIGNFAQIIYKSWKENGIVNAMKAYKKEYGNIYTLWFGPMPTVHIVDYELAKDQMIKHGSEFTLRFVPEIQSYNRGGLGIILNDGEIWQEHRRFALVTLRNFGLGRNIMEMRIMDEFNFRLKNLKQTMNNGEVITNPTVFFDVLVGNIINQLLFAERLAEDNSEFWEIKKALDESLETTTFLDLVVPVWIMKSPLFSWRMKLIQGPQVKLTTSLVKKLDRRQQEYADGSKKLTEDAEDFVDAYFYKMQEDKANGVASSFDMKNLIVDLLDLWSAGQETTSTTLTWGTVLLLNNPEYIDKIHQEVLEVTKGQRHLSLSDRAATPLLNATLNEIQRIASILNFNLFRRTEKAQNILGYEIPADVAITAQIAVIMADDTTFPDSDKFDPTRFLIDEKRVTHVVPFGMGKRACLGESLARAELYLILGNFLLNCDIKPAGDLPKPRPLNETGFLKRPPKFQCKILMRN